MVSPSNHRPYIYLVTILPLSSFDLKLELSRVCNLLILVVRLLSYD